MEHNVRSTKSGGGVALFVRNGIDYHVRNYLTVMNESLETLFIEIDKEVMKSENNIIIGLLYRPPGTDKSIFSEELNTICTRIKPERKICHMIGDYNSNLLNAESHPPTQDFLNCMYSNSFFPVITKPTRVTSSSATLIDNLFTNAIANAQSFTGILYATSGGNQYTNHHIWLRGMGTDKKGIRTTGNNIQQSPKNHPPPTPTDTNKHPPSRNRKYPNRTNNKEEKTNARQ